MDSVHAWVIERQLTIMDNALRILIELSGSGRGLSSEESDSLRDLEENLVDICSIYSNFLKDGEKDLFRSLAAKLESLWRSINGVVTSSQVDPSMIESFRQAREIIARLLKVDMDHDAPTGSGSSNKYLIGGIWDFSLLILLARLHVAYSRIGYCIVGGVAVQMQVAMLTGRDISKNIRLKAECRSTHDVDIIFPEGTSFEPKALVCHGEFKGMKYRIDIGRTGDKRPMYVVMNLSTGKQTEIFLNITTTYKDARNSTPQLYAMEFERAPRPTFYFQDKAFMFRFASVEDIMISKLCRMNDNDSYDVNLLMHLYPMSGKSIDFNYVMRHVPNQFNGFVKKYLETTFHKVA